MEDRLLCGGYWLIMSAEYGIPFYVLGPTSTIDMKTPTGDKIEIELRDSEEIGNGFGKRTAPVGVKAYNPAFDVTDNKYVTAIPGAAYFHHADSFAMIRGGHIDICVLGAYQVSEEGDLANWSTGNPNDIPAVGGAMDLVAGVKTIFVITKHTTKTGESKIVKQCTYPLTGKNVVSRIYTNFAIIDVRDKQLCVRELAPGVSYEFLQEHTEATLHME